MNIQELYEIYLQNPIISTDTRIIKKKSLFFCLIGDNFNGNDFALQALELGAKYVVSDDIKNKNIENVFIVKNALHTLQELAKYHRINLNIPIIGITGTNGKTTTKELISTVLSSKYKTFATYGNLNNHIGVPLSILSIPKDIEIAVIEMGANHIGEIAELCEISQPTHGIITNIGKAHLQGFKNIEGVLETKKALYQYLEKINGIVFINKNDKVLFEISNFNNKIFYENIKTLNIEPYLSVIFDNEIISSNLIGDYNFNNLNAAITIGKYFKVPTISIKTSIENYFPKNNRSQFIKTENNELFLDAYNANPSSMDAALNYFAKLNKNNKVIILGDMLELGNESEKEHLKIIDKLKNENDVAIFLIGTEFSKFKNNNFKTFSTNIEAFQFFQINKIVNSYIMIKGSRGIKLESLIELF